MTAADCSLLGVDRIIQEMLVSELSHSQLSQAALTKEIEILTEKSTLLLSLFTRQEEILQG